METSQNFETFDVEYIENTNLSTKIHGFENERRYW